MSIPNKSRQRTAGGFLYAFCALVFLPFFLGASNFASNDRKADIAEFVPLVPPSQEFPMGERLVYDVSWIGVPIGVGEVWVKERTTLAGREVFHVMARIKTNGVVALIYPVDDEIHSWIDARTLESLKFTKKISEGAKREEQTMVFDPPAHDVLSSFYWMRRQDLAPGGSVKVTVMADHKKWPLTVAGLRRVKLNVRKTGRIDTLTIEPKSVVKGKVTGDTVMHLKNDASRVPMRITYKAPFGPIIGVLRSVN